MIQKQKVGEPGYYGTSEKLTFKSITLEEEQELFRRYRERNDLAARDKIITNHLLLVAKLASMFIGGTPEGDEVVSAANMGLLKAIERFDYTRGNRFASYVRKFVRGEIARFCRANRIVHTPTSRATAVIVPLPEKNIEAQALDKTSLITEQSLTKEEYAQTAAKALRNAIRRKCISPIERHVVRQHYFHGRTYKDIGLEMPPSLSAKPLSRQRVEQIHKSVCEKLRGLLKTHYGIDWIL